MFVLLSSICVSISPQFTSLSVYACPFLFPSLFVTSKLLMESCHCNSSFEVKLYSTLSGMSSYYVSVRYCCCVYYLLPTRPEVCDPYR